MSLRRSARNATKIAALAPVVDLQDVVVADGHIEAPSEASSKTPSKAPSKAPKKRKTATVPKSTKITDADLAVPDLPVAPLPKKRKAVKKVSSAKASSLETTPAITSSIVLPSPSTEADLPLENSASLKARPAEPHATNAPLLTSNDIISSQNENASPTKKRKAKELVLPDVGTLNPSTSTTDTLLSDAEAFMINVDPKLKSVIESHTCKIFSPEGLSEVIDPFTKLSSGIIGQQVSGQAANSILKKFTALFPSTHPSFPTPAQVLTFDLPTLRTAGLSQRKAEYIHGLAEKFDSGELTAQMLISATDDELIEKLVAVRGLGRWSVEMFAFFGLKRMNVFSTGDLGVQRGMAAYMGRDINKLKSKGGKWKYMSEQEMLSIAARFSPYRSLFMWYMWRIADVDTSVLKDEKE